MSENSDLNLDFDHKRRALFEQLLQRENIRSKTVSIIRRRDQPAQLPLSFGQERLWFLDQLEGGGGFYNIPFGMRLKGVLAVAALAAGLKQIVERHEVLRTHFAVVGGQPQQVIEPAGVLPLAQVDLSGLGEPQREREAQRLCAEEAQRPFDLAQGPVVRATLIRVGSEEHIFLLVMHHIAADGWSLGVLVRELKALYEAFGEGKASPLPELAVQYADYAVWQREWLSGEVLVQQLDYWKRQLAGAPARLELPADKPRPLTQSHRGALQQLELPPSLLTGLAEISRREGASLFMTLLAAFQTLLQRYTGLEDIVVGSPIAGRNRSELEGLVGFFVNTLVLRGDLSGDPSFRELLRRTRETALGAYAHQDLPFEKLVAELQPERDAGHSPLFQVMFVLQNTPEEAAGLAGLAVAPVLFDNPTAKFDLTLFVMEQAEGLQVAVEYNTDLFEAATMVRLLGHYQRLLEGIVANPDARISALPLLSLGERERLLMEWNQTAIDYPREQTIHGLFEEQAERTPDAVAVVFEKRQLTYRELNERANQLAHHLLTLGVKPDTLVGICVERSLEMVVGLLGILKAGGAYVPLDPEYPKERLAFMLADAKPLAVLTQASMQGELPPHPGRVICLDEGGVELAGEPTSNPASHAQPHHLAYVIYTSGSTGQPKGVAIEHRNAVNFSHWGRAAFSDAEMSGVLAVTSICFDLSIFELWVTLNRGGKVILAENALQLPRLPARNQVTLINTVPSAMAELLSSGSLPANVQVINLAGEPLPTSLVDRLYALKSVNQVNDLYGPTETTTYSTFTLRRRGEKPSIGRPIANTQIYLLDGNLELVPIGVAGELHIGGDGLARGYLNRPELTAEKFIPHPFSSEPGARLYKTGDLARYLPDGNIEYLGRLDQQVKIRGFRIELGEIEAVLGSHPAIRECVVTAWTDAAGVKALAAYLVGGPATVPTLTELREFLLQTLPDYMVPAAFVVLEKLPLTPNGKVDRKALPAPDENRLASGTPFVAPGNYSEQILHGIWCEVLNVKRVGVRDNFFDLGGHSLLAVRLMGEINKLLKVNLHIPVFFQNPTIEKLAKILEQDQLVRNVPQLMLLQPGQSAGSLFLLDAGIGLCRLAEQMNTGPASFATVASLSPQKFRATSFGDLADLPSMEELAAPHTALIRNSLQPGPCMLAGHSFGGLLAFEVAHQLEREGRQAEMVFLFDSWVGFIPWWQKLRVLTLDRAKKSFAFRVNHLWNKTQAGISRALERPAALFKPSNHSPDNLIDVNVPFGQISWDVLSKIYFQAQKNYQLRPLNSRAVLFRAQDSEFKHLYPIDGDLGWSGLFRGGLEVVDIPGDHFTLLKAPNLQLLVQQLQARTEKIKLDSIT